MTTPTTTPKPRRRWLQYRLRTLLLLMLLAGCLFAWLGSEYRRGKRQKEAIRWVEAQGGHVEYDHAATRANWRKSVFGDWFPASVKTVYLFEFWADGAEPLAQFKSLEQLTLMNAPAHDVMHWAETGELPPRPALDLTPLASLQHLRVLRLYHSAVEDLAPLAELTQLEELHLDSTPTRDLTPLAGLKELRVLSLNQTRVEDLTALAGLQNLESLRLQSFAGTDEMEIADISPLAQLTNLQSLELDYQPIHDLTPLHGLSNLRSITLYGLPITQADIAALHAALPACEIKSHHLPE